MLRNFDTDLDVQQTTRIVTTVPTVTSTVRTHESREHLLADESDWGWQALRDYVVSSIVDKFGPFPRNTNAEIGIFKAFKKRWGDDAILIAHAAFDVYDGYWQNAPISVTRFCLNSDPYFATPIAERLAATQV